MPSTAKYMKRYRLDRATGIRRTVPPGRALAHLETLHDAGMTWHAIARAAGVAPTTVTSAVHHMRTGRALHSATEARWLAVPYTPPTASRGSLRRRRDVGVARRLQALAAIGWTFTDLAARLHIVPPAVSNAAAGKPVSGRVAADVRRLYGELSMTVPTGPAAVARRTKATQMGWVPPMAWDDIDDPLEEPKGVATGRAA